MLEMSRRSRQRRKVAGEPAKPATPAKRGWVGKVAVGLLVAVLVGGVTLFVTVRNYLRGDGFRQLLSEMTSDAVGVDGKFAPLRWNGLKVDTKAFEASGDGIIRSVQSEGLHTEVHLRGVMRGVWEIHNSSMRRLEVFLDARDRGTAGSGKKSPPPAKGSSWLPQEVELHGLDVAELQVNATLEAGPLSVSGQHVRVDQVGTTGAYKMDVRELVVRDLHDAGTPVVSGVRVRAEQVGSDGGYRVNLVGEKMSVIRLPLSWVPELRLLQASLRYHDGAVFFDQSTAGAGDAGLLEITSGKWDLATGCDNLTGTMSDLKCEEVFNEDWAKRCSGDMSSGFKLNKRNGELVAWGHLEVHNGILTALPVLDVLAAYVDTRDFRTLKLSEAKTDWQWKPGEILLSNLVLSSKNLVRLEGNLSIRGRDLDGRFRLGLAPGTLAAIPGAETEVFKADGSGLEWAPLRITGTLDDPQEDLSGRLKDAAGMRIFEIIPETGEQVLKFADSLPRNPAQAVDQGLKIIEQGGKAASEVTNELQKVTNGLFGDLLGPVSPPDPPKDTPINPP